MTEARSGVRTIEPARAGLSHGLDIGWADDWERFWPPMLETALAGRQWSGECWAELRQARRFGDCLAAVLTRQLAGPAYPLHEARELVTQALSRGELEQHAWQDLAAHCSRDPCVRFPWQPLLFAKGFHAVTLHRIAHQLWHQGQQLAALAIQHQLSLRMAVDIHPAARIGVGMFLDHATGLVIGETAEVGRNVSLLHGTTLGSCGGERGQKRHPTVEDDVLIGAGAMLIGPIRVGRGAKIGAGAVVVKDVKAGCTVLGQAAQPLMRD